MGKAKKKVNGKAKNGGLAKADFVEPEYPRLLTVRIGGYAGLEDDVELSIAPQRTILVGKNGSGKSLILEGITLAAQAALHIARSTPPQRFHCTIQNSESVVGYDYSFSKSLAGSSGTFAEHCIRDRREVWRVSNNEVRFRNKESMLMPPGTGILGFSLIPAQEATGSASMVKALFSSLRGVGPGLPRQADRSRHFVNAQPIPRSFQDTVTWRLDLIAETIIAWAREQDDRFTSLSESGRRIELFNDLVVQVLRSEAKKGMSDPDLDAGEIGEVLLDGVNLGQVADGTLRILEILTVLIGSDPGQVILIEEPETAVHPGLLEGLLAEIDSYAIDRQIIIATHSYQVVSAAKPHEIRLVERTNGKTSVRGLRNEEVERLASFLNLAGSLGDFVYGGSLDDQK